ncbi:MULTISPECIES: ectoine synthase [Kitasatospora]|uniref:L-ectoine synthase n=2 Tax=Kitasatospora TaxID=2063 RepID=A0A919G0N6_9ACTN|nr:MULTISPECIES: ectoine synthase [Kitasatospora]MDQ0310092.1 L-ectoine synthase [Kitasatospora herbaricolor]GGV17747.1 L-ectoine synthase [Kitasatospora herbaricolor]GHH75890.1 L-ectoine synthase [Kitasatospora indigofera]
MFIRSMDEIKAVDWGNGTSHRFLLERDRMGFTVCHTVVRAGSKSKLEYRRHLEACYCIGGSGQVVSAETGESYEIRPGVLYALDEHDAHFLIASPHEDLELVSVFNPPLHGEERHQLDGDGFSHY